MPSPLTSPSVTATGYGPVLKDCWAPKAAVVDPGAVALRSTDTELAPPLAVTTSGKPSPLTSPTATLMGPLPVAKVCWPAKAGVDAPGAVLFKNTDTVLLPWLATITSGMPSPFTSASATDTG